jgi:hypothetical protein
VNSLAFPHHLQARGAGRTSNSLLPGKEGRRLSTAAIFACLRDIARGRELMGGCEPGHEWRPERETPSLVRYRCADCGSVCVAPKPVDQLGLDVRWAPTPRQAPAAAPGRPTEAPRWASVAHSASSPAG